MENTTINALSLEEAHRLLHKLHNRLADLERENDHLKRTLKALDSANDRSFTAPEVLPDVNNQRDLIDSGQYPNLLRCIIDSVGDLIYVKDREGRYLACNAASEKFLGIKESEQIGKTDFDFFDLKFAETIREKDIQIFSSGLEAHVEEWVTSSDGKRVLLDSLKAPFYGLDGTIAGLVGISRDITERTQVEAKIQQLNSDLAARAIELENANQELEAFNYSVSHDLRHPLTIINGYCHIMQKLCRDNLTTECRGYLEKIYKGTESMAQLIDALLNFSFPMHTALHRETINLSRIANTVCTELVLTDPGRRVAFRIASGITADGDENLLRVVLENLLGNAWKFTGTREDAVVEFGVMDVDGTSTYFISDNGIGFDMAHADKLFMPFQRLHKIDAEGYGIGLSTVERIIKRHGGKLWAEGEAGKGAIFYFTV